MNSAVSEAVLIGLDWGTSSLRAYLIGQNGDVLDQIDSNQGILNVKERAFDPLFHSLLTPWPGHGELPVIGAGMITSKNGWIETPYLSTPAGSEALSQALSPHKTSQGRLIHFITGLCHDPDGTPDVMRGEETQIVGAAALGYTEGLFVMPGTHNKWVDVKDGKISRFKTYMTGEIFALLKTHSILGTLMQNAPFDKDTFLQAVRIGQNTGPDLLHRLFHVRSLPLFDKITPFQIADHLSGLLIGNEIAGVVCDIAPKTPITIVGRGDLCNRYSLALECAGFPSQTAPDGIAARGLYEIAKSAGLIT